MAITDEAFERMYRAAVESGKRAQETEPRAIAARYDEASGRVIVELLNGATFAFPSELGEGLAGATAAQLSDITIRPAGIGLYWPQLGADLSVPNLLSGVFGFPRWMKSIGRAGGLTKSDAKAAAARANGKKGGRPRRAIAETTSNTTTARAPKGK